MNHLLKNNLKYKNNLSLKNKLGRGLWNFTSFFLFRPFTLILFWRYRRFVLRCFGAKIGKYAGAHSSAKIWAPWNLEIGDYSTIGPHVICYNPDKIKIGSYCTISQYSYLCTASHDINIITNPLITAPIIIKSRAWVAADAFIGMGVTIGEGSVVGARSSVFKDVADWSIVGGNPARFIKKRTIQEME